VTLSDIPENIETVIQNPRVQKVEKLHKNKSIEEIGIVNRVFVIVRFAAIAVHLPPVHDQLVLPGLQLPLSYGVN